MGADWTVKIHKHVSSLLPILPGKTRVIVHESHPTIYSYTCLYKDKPNKLLLLVTRGNTGMSRPPSHKNKGLEMPLSPFEKHSFPVFVDEQPSLKRTSQRRGANRWFRGRVKLNITFHTKEHARFRDNTLASRLCAWR